MKLQLEKLDQYLKDKGFNGSVLVASKDHVILRKGYGYANVKDQVLTTPRTKYRIGSITKNSCCNIYYATKRKREVEH
ncbi:serine hydrolase [Bacillus cereus]